LPRLRQLSYAALAVAYAHLVFGAIVRISGSGMGCGDNWPKCHGYWFPPMDRPDLVVEVSHRYLASLLTATLAALAAVAWLRRAEPGVGGRGGVLRSALGALVVVLVTALLGALTVRLGNPPWATVAHWTLAMTLLAVLVTTAIRAGALGGESALMQTAGAASAKTLRGALAAAGIAFLAVALGGLTAKYPGASIACRTFPLCGRNPEVVSGAVHVQLSHRALAFLLFLHLLGLSVVLRRRPDALVVKRAAQIALTLAAIQIALAAAMVLLRLPPILRSSHEAVGVLLWLACFAFAYLARRAMVVVRTAGSHT
jgi:cytochrome c oxidase assembly protein subunit 15